LMSCLKMSPTAGRADAMLASSTLNYAWNFLHSAHTLGLPPQQHVRWS
jgi:hypothetical protein